jgi:hypothetical protein
MADTKTYKILKTEENKEKGEGGNRDTEMCERE